MGFLSRFSRSSREKRVFVLGLDCAAPELVFDRWRDELPALSGLARAGLWGELQSSTPAITVPAWASMLSGRDPGELGIYGFRNRADHSYDRMFIATSNYVKEKRIWDYLTEAGKQSVVIGVPQTYPVPAINGCMISDFLTPGIQKQFTYPESLRQEVLSISPDYDFDVPQFRTEDKRALLSQIWAMTEKRFRVADHLLKSKPWDFFMLMEIGVDRIHHGFWSYHDPEHWRYEPGNPFQDAIRDYYKWIDARLGEWLEWLGEEAVVIVVSDHGAKRMDGGICVNEWLRREGWLVLKQDPPVGEPVPFDKVEVDWERTRAWGSGGYYARIFLNVEGREPQGPIAPSEYESTRDELARQLAAITDPQGRDIGTKVFRPQDIYRNVKGVAPDLLVYFGDLFWRSVGSFGFEDIYTFENDTGPDDCNHAENGMVILWDPSEAGQAGELHDAQLMDMTPTLLTLMDVPLPTEVQGLPLRRRLEDPTPVG